MLAEVIPAKPEPITTTSYSGLRPARKSFGIAKSGERAESKDRNADERGRTSTAICIRPLDPESSASANSATSAFSIRLAGNSNRKQPSKRIFCRHFGQVALVLVMLLEADHPAYVVHPPVNLPVVPAVLLDLVGLEWGCSHPIMESRRSNSKVKAFIRDR